MSDTPMPQSLTHHLNQLGVVMLIRKPETPDKETLVWRPTETEKEPPF